MINKKNFVLKLIGTSCHANSKKTKQFELISDFHSFQVFSFFHLSSSKWVPCSVGPTKWLSGVCRAVLFPGKMLILSGSESTVTDPALLGTSNAKGRVSGRIGYGTSKYNLEETHEGTATTSRTWPLCWPVAVSLTCGSRTLDDPSPRIRSASQRLMPGCRGLILLGVSSPHLWSRAG